MSCLIITRSFHPLIHQIVQISGSVSDLIQTMFLQLSVLKSTLIWWMIDDDDGDDDDDDDDSWMME